MLMHYCGRISANGEATLHERCHVMNTFGANLVNDDSLCNGANSIIMHRHKFNHFKTEIRLNVILWFNSHLLYIFFSARLITFSAL
jgi:hypothetical protein